MKSNRKEIANNFCWKIREIFALQIDDSRQYRFAPNHVKLKQSGEEPTILATARGSGQLRTTVDWLGDLLVYTQTHTTGPLCNHNYLS